MSRGSFPLLFTPIRIAGVEIRNRLVLTAHGTGMAQDLLPSQQLIDYYTERAKGGVGLIMIGSQQVHPTSPGITGLLCNYDESIIPGLRQIMEALHARGTKAFAQLSHMGLATTARPQPLWSASPIAEQKYGEVAHEMTVSEIREVVAAFASAAARCIDAGMDGISIHCAHGLLIHQFMSPYTNKRTDAYGGDMQNRLRFPTEILEGVRGHIGPHHPLGIRISADELVDGGLTLSDMQKMVPLLIDAGQLNFVDVSAGNDGHVMSNMLHEPPMGIPTGNLLPLAAGIREVVEVPVIHGTRINSPVLAEKALQDGLTDLVGMCRPLIADPHLPNKARAGRVEDIQPCIACNQACLGRLHRGKHISCVGNPVTGRETEWATLSLAPRRKRVIVVGAGVAGLEAAMIASRRGHDVILFEKETQLGGQVLIAAKAPMREEIADVIRYRINQLNKSGVVIRTGVEATADSIVDESPDAVVVATGAVTTRPDLPGNQSNNVFNGEQVLNGTADVGQRVVVLDYVDYRRGLTVADYLAERGREVEIITAGPAVGHRMVSQNFAFLYHRLLEKDVVLTPHTQVAAIEKSRVLTRNVFTMAERTIDGVDTVVMVTPGRANDGLFRTLRGRVPETYSVGDCVAPRDIEAAILEGHAVGRRL